MRTFIEKIDVNVFEIKRILDAPIEMVFKAWTEAKRLEQWWGPKGSKIKIVKLDLRPKGIFHYSQVMPDGQEMWGRFIYNEIESPSRLIFVNSFSDKEGNIKRAPFSSTLPLEILNHLTLSGNSNKTNLLLRGGPINATKQEIDTFTAFENSMNEGFGGTFDQLDEYLSKL